MQHVLDPARQRERRRVGRKGKVSRERYVAELIVPPKEVSPHFTAERMVASPVLSRN